MSYSRSSSSNSATDGSHKDNHQLVDAETGEATTLEGDALAAAQKAKTVIARATYSMRKYNHQLVDAGTGEATTLEGDALAAAQKAKTVITMGAYRRRKHKRTTDSDADVNQQNDPSHHKHKKPMTASQPSLVTRFNLFPPQSTGTESPSIEDNDVEMTDERVGTVDLLNILCNVATVKLEPRSP